MQVSNKLGNLHILLIGHSLDQYQRFTQMMYAPSYAVMLDHKKHEILDVKSEDNSAYFFIELTSANGIMFGFKWTLEKVIEEGVFKDCWMTTGVSTPMPLSTSS